ncbi:hypothetical protein J3E71DRAFT_169721 [Bipolaris maydis]|nr:hypothetical protein J3E71DRAFT_169721 [Bipolaris maydis]
MYHLQVPNASVTTSPTLSWSTPGANWNASTLAPAENISQWTQPYHPLISWPTSPSQQVVEIVVGAAGMLSFNPKSVTVSIGTILRFNFLSLNHTLTQSSLDNPCSNSSRFDTGFNQFNPKNISGKFLVDYPVNTTEPKWFYCAQKIPRSHCEAGMVFSLNPQNGSTLSMNIEPSSTSAVSYCHTIPSTSSGLQPFPSKTSMSRNASNPQNTSILPAITNNAAFYTPKHRLIPILPLLLYALLMFCYY